MTDKATVQRNVKRWQQDKARRDALKAAKDNAPLTWQPFADLRKVVRQ
jgi:hypothetical protein